MTPRKSPGAWREDIARGLEGLALYSGLVTVCLLPWLLGGTIPLARLLLQCGTTLAAVPALAAMLLVRRTAAAVPTGVVLLTGLALLGIGQLLPVYPAPVSQMNHAVYADQRTAAFLPDRPSAEPFTSTRTTSPADTRLAVAQWLALSQLLWVIWLTASTPRRQVACLLALALNGVCLAMLGVLQLASDGRMLFGADWVRFESQHFATFTNSNNAAGWLLTSAAAAAGFMLQVWGGRARSVYSRPFGQPSFRERLWLAGDQLRQRLAALSIPQLSSGLILLFVLLGIASTLSRSGIVAACGAGAACSLTRLSWRNALGVLSLMLMVLLGVVGLLAVLNLDEAVVVELQTLQDPVSDIRGRVLHWRDVLVSLFDFPLIGSGMNAYRFSTLPYVSYSFQKWFYHADNQFVEVLVEAGVAGFLLFAGFWGLILTAGLRLVTAAAQSRARGRAAAQATGLVCIWLAVAQVISGMLDYGVGLPASLSSVVVLLGLACVQFDVQRLPMQHQQLSVRDTGILWHCHHWLAILWFTGQMLASASYVPDLLAAHRIHTQSLALQRILQKPQPQTMPASLNLLSENLIRLHKTRPDDADGLDALLTVEESRFRLRLIQELHGAPLTEETEFAQMWSNCTPPALADRLLNLWQQPDQSAAIRVQRVALDQLRRHPWFTVGRLAQARLPLMPGIAIDLVCLDVLTSYPKVHEPLVMRALFTEPGNARRLFQLGYLCLYQRRPDLCRRLWSASLAVSEDWRPAILDHAVSHWSVTDAVHLFGPTSYEASVHAALATSHQEVQQQLWDEAERQWSGLASEPTAGQRRLRAMHLRQTAGPQVAVDWLGECLVVYPEHLQMRLMRAELLEQLGDPAGAAGEWLRIQHFHPAHPGISAALKRLGQ